MARLDNEKVTLDRFRYMTSAKQQWKCTKKYSRTSLVICAQSRRYGGSPGLDDWSRRDWPMSFSASPRPNGRRAKLLELLAHGLGWVDFRRRSVTI